MALQSPLAGPAAPADSRACNNEGGGTERNEKNIKNEKNEQNSLVNASTSSAARVVCVEIVREGRKEYLAAAAPHSRNANSDAGGGVGGGAGVASARLEWLPRGKSSVTQYAGIYPHQHKNTHIYGRFILLYCYCCMCVLTLLCMCPHSRAMYVSS